MYNEQLMNTLDKLAAKMDKLPNRADLRSVEAELTNKLHQSTVRFEKKIQDNTREIQDLNLKMNKQDEAVARLVEEIEKQK